MLKTTLYAILDLRTNTLHRKYAGGNVYRKSGASSVVKQLNKEYQKINNTDASPFVIVTAEASWNLVDEST